MKKAALRSVRLFCASIFLLGIAAAAEALDLSGKWIGTHESSTVYCDVPPTSSGPAEVEVTQIGDSFSGTFLWVWANPETCIPSSTSTPYLLDLSGTVDGNSFQAVVSFPGEGEIGTLTGSVSGDVMSFTFIIPTGEDHDDPTELIDTIVTAQLTHVPPAITASVDVSSLWPPNHAMVDVGLISATDDGSAAFSYVVYSDEDDGASRDASGTLLLRAERAGTGDGRVYLIVITASDAFSSMSRSCLTVVVPKSQSASDIASVNEQAAAALSQCPLPVGYFVVGM